MSPLLWGEGKAECPQSTLLYLLVLEPSLGQSRDPGQVVDLKATARGEQVALASSFSSSPAWVAFLLPDGREQLGLQGDLPNKDSMVPRL